MKTIIAATILSLAFLLGGLASARAATLTVTKIADTNDNVCDADCSLREAIFAAAASGDTIEFASPLFDTGQLITLALGELYSNKTLTINGRSSALTVIYGNDQSRVFDNGGNLTLNRITITGGKDFGGSGIYNDAGSTLALTDSVVSGNRLFGGAVVVYRGAGIFNAANSTVTITGSTISNNAGNGSRENEGIGIANLGAMTIRDSTISGNGIVGAVNRNQGGGIYNEGTAAIINTTISGNNVFAFNFGFGGGIYNVAQQGALTLINSTIAQNNANSNLSNPGACSGGGIYSSGGIKAVNAIISGNTSCFSPDFNSRFTVNINNFVGGDAKLAPLSNYGGTTQTRAFSAVSPAMNAGNVCVLTANSCGFSHPALTTDQRGAGFPRSVGAAVDIGAFEYGTLYFTPATLPVALLNVAYSQQISVTGGIAPHAVTFDSGTLPSGITLSSSGLLSGTTAQQGTFNFTVQATDSDGLSVLKNYVLNVGYYVLNASGSGAGSLRQIIIDTPAGGTIQFDPTFFNVPRTILVTGSEIIIERNVTLIGTGANLLTIDAANTSRVFAIQDGKTFTVSDVKITRGSTIGNGGCVYVLGVFNLVNSEISNCSANLGGAIYNASSGTTNLVGSTVSGSQAMGSGGGIFADGLLLLTNSIVENNNAPNVGGIYVEANRTATLTRSIVRLNTATGGAGGIYNSGTLNFYDSTLSGNTAQTAGGLGNNGFANFANSTISGNRATTDKGAGIYNGGGRVVHLLNTTITNNQSDATAGAGIWNENFSNPTITIRARNTIIAGNVSGAGNPVDYVGDFTNLGNNLINNNNPGLAPLANYGGATPEHALLPNSPALNAGDNCALVANTCGIAHSALSDDQRGTNSPRRIGANVDIGAFERNITIDQMTLPNGVQSGFYNQTFTVTRATSFAENSLTTEKFKSSSADFLFAPFTFSIITVPGQALPPGLTLASNGSLSGTPTQAGTYTFTVKATDTDAMAGAAQYTMQVFAPTAATVYISGRVLTPTGRGLSKARVTLLDSNGNSRTVLTGSFGYYRFDDVSIGETYIVGVVSKRFIFTTQVISVMDDIAGLNFTANE